MAQGGKAASSGNGTAEVKQILKGSFSRIKDIQVLLMRINAIP